MYERFSALLPHGVLTELRRQLNYNGLTMSERKFGGFLFVYGAALAITIGIGAFVVFGFSPLAVAAATAAAFFFSVYALLKLNSDAKGRFVECILPDALQIIASNMKSGLTAERALFVAGRPEFGALQAEMRNASKRISSGVPMGVALVGISDRISSATLRKTLWLISEGIRSGGQISDLLYQLADDLKAQQAIQEEIRANISIYVLLILFASMVGAPLLFGVSSFIVQVLTKQISATPKINVTASVGGAEAIKGFVTGERSLVSTDFVILFSVVTLIGTAVLASMTIGVINTGKELDGIKFTIPMAVVAVAIFFAARVMLLGTLGSIAT